MGKVMIHLDPDKKLQRLAKLRVDLDYCSGVYSSGISIVSDGDRFFCPFHGLAVLDIFSRPTSFRDALDVLRRRVSGPRDLIDLTNTIASLYEYGLLQEEDQARRSRSGFGQKAFDTARAHVVMLNDRARTSSFLAAIREVVRPGDVVVDIGTGTGVLAVAAARAGARHVYAIEVGNIGHLARSVFKANGLADRITLVEGWSTQVNLPERANVLVSEIVGNEPLGENVLEITSDAVERLLTADARLIPHRLRIYALAVSVPASQAARVFIAEEAVHKWNDWYGIDFSPLAQTGRTSPSYIFLRPHLAQGWPVLCDPILLADVDLRTAQPVVDRRVVATAAASGVLNGVLIYFELELSSHTVLSISPDRVDDTCSWLVPVWVLPEAFCLQAGARFAVSYTHRGPGMRGRLEVDRL